VKADYLIIGQGICGTLLSYELLKAGKTVLVIDAYNSATASRVASGLINPVTGKRIVASWMIDELLPVAQNTYQSLEQHLGVDLLKSGDILEFYRTVEEKAMFYKRLNEGCQYLAEGNDTEAAKAFDFHRGTGIIKDCLLIDLPLLLERWREVLSEQGALIADVFDWEELDIKEKGVSYKGMEAERVILCNGVAGFDNPWFSGLPYSLNKGEALIVSIPGLSPAYIYKQGIKIIPWKDDLFWIGASYEWKYDNAAPTDAFRQKVEGHLKHWLKLPFEIQEHWASERPATVNYKPFAGFHPLYPQIGILNGMGSKGCSQAPYFARQMVTNLIHNSPINPEVDIKRFSRILSR
jgi:glycine/D-amino acid oxidase-like deaminating enzyme